MKNLFVGNLSFQTTDSELTSLFEPFGTVSKVQVITDRDTGQSRGFAFVEMSNDEEATSAIGALNGKEVNGRALNVNEARPKKERSPRGGGFSGEGYSRSGGYRR
ncbi:MAG TPA: RNA-binding protein [Terriglobia bacterium]|nr:RNA-binding protein [Terriglobia bacterium]